MLGILIIQYAQNSEKTVHSTDVFLEMQTENLAFKL